MSREAPSSKAGHDDALESPLTELGLIKAVGRKDGFRFVRGPKTTLGDGVFTYALAGLLVPLFQREPHCPSRPSPYAPGGPGRVFLFDENDVADRLAALRRCNGWRLAVVRNRRPETGCAQFQDIDDEAALSWIRADYDALAGKEAA